jgi:two-component system response regulator FixJ
LTKRLQACFHILLLRIRSLDQLRMEQTIFVIDDDAAIRDSLRMMLEMSGYTVRDFASAQAFLSEADLAGGCLIVDIRMPGMGGLELQEELVRRKVNIPVIVITGHGDVPLAVRAMRAGAMDFVEKPFDGERMLQSVADALEAGQRAQSRAAEAKAARDLLNLLTPREREILDQLVKGHANKVVAHQLGISPRTVEIHRASIMEKLHARNLSNVVRTALAASWEMN